MERNGLLVLSRHAGEEIMIGGGVGLDGRPAVPIRLVVVEIRGDKVRLGIEAPPDVVVDRREVFEAKRTGIASGELRRARQQQRRERRRAARGAA
jgi:carbon storage regulator